MSNKRRLEDTWRQEDSWRPEKRVCIELKSQPFRDPFSIDSAPPGFGSGAAVSNFNFWASGDIICRNKRKRSLEDISTSKRPKARNATPEPPCDIFSRVNPRKRQRDNDAMDLENFNPKRRRMEVEDTSVDSENDEPLEESGISNTRKRKFGFDPVIRKRIRANDFTSLVRCLESAHTDNVFTWHKTQNTQNNFIR